MLAILKNRFQFIGLVLIGIGFVYQEATPFFLSVGSILLCLSAFVPPYSIEKDKHALGIIVLWLFAVISGLWSENTGNWSAIVVRQLALVFIPLAVLSGLQLSTNQKKKVDQVWIGLSALFAVISLLRYLLHKNQVDLSLLESGAIPIWDGVSLPWKLDAISSSKFLQSGVNHIYFSILQALAIFMCWRNWRIDRQKLWLVLGIIHLVSIHWFLARTGLLALYFGAALIFIHQLFRSKRRKWLFASAFVALLLPLVSYTLFESVRNKLQNSLEDLQAVRGERSINHRSLAMRIEAWHTASDLIKEHPFGVGAGDVGDAMKRKYEENHTLLWEENRIPPHNQYLETALASGILASLLLIGLLLSGIQRAWKDNDSMLIGVFASLLLALCFESILQTQLGICIFPFAILLLKQQKFSRTSMQSSRIENTSKGLPYSVVIITYNEAKRIEELLQSIQGADEIIVVDSFSEDGTVEICKKHGATVIQQAFLGFGQQKQFGVDSAKNDWIFSLDADEVPDEKCWHHIQSLLQAEPEIKAWIMKRHLVFMGRAFLYGKEANDKQLRFFNRNYAHWSTSSVHETLVYEGKRGVLDGTVAHKSYESIDNYFGKFNRYTSLAAQDLVKRKKFRSSFSNILGVHLNFIKFYFLQLNFLNGYPGYCWSLFSSIYSLVKHSKASERKT